MIKSIVFFCFLSTWSLFLGQSYKIIIINNGDTTVISSDPNSMDSLIELNMKSMYGIGTDMERVFKDVQVEVFIDSILNQSAFVLEEPADTVRFKVGNKRIVVIEKDKKGDKNQRKIIIDEEASDRIGQIDQGEDKDYSIKDDQDESFFKNQHASWAGFGIGLNSFMNSNDRFFSESDAPFLVLDYAKSVNLQFNVWEKKFPIYQEFIGVTTGLGFQWNRYGLEKNVDIAANADSIYAMNNVAVNYTKNVLRSTYLQIPLLLEFNSNKSEHNNWHLSLGVVGGVRIASSWKTKWEDDGKPLKAKTKDDFNFNSLSANAYAQIGYGNVGLFVQYGLIDVFRPGKGPALSPISGGICFNF
ncbi:MAG: outer membrane beta-barrel protein [Bacteroidota bacterium]